MLRAFKPKCILLLLGLLLTVNLVSCRSTVSDTGLDINMQTPASASNADDGATKSIERTDIIFDSPNINDKLTVRFFYLESKERSGDAIFIKAPDGASMLIDAGNTDTAGQLISYLKKLGVERLDYVVLTHTHIDHLGGMPDVFTNFEVGTLVQTRVPSEYSAHDRMMALADEKKVKLFYPRDGEQFMLGNDIGFEALVNEKDMENTSINKTSTEFINNHSLILRMQYKNCSFLFPGDIYKDAEFDLVNNKSSKIDVDVLKVPHHGHDTSSSLVFAQAVTPKYSIIPSNILISKTVYDRYKSVGSKVYIPALDGNILLVCDGQEVMVLTEKDRTVPFEP